MASFIPQYQIYHHILPLYSSHFSSYSPSQATTVSSAPTYFSGGHAFPLCDSGGPAHACGTCLPLLLHPTVLCHHLSRLSLPLPNPKGTRVISTLCRTSTPDHEVSDQLSPALASPWQPAKQRPLSWPVIARYSPSPPAVSTSLHDASCI